MSASPTRKTILITGAAGFIASNLTLKIYETFQNSNIIAIDKLSYCSSSHHFDHIDDSRFKFIVLDITDSESLLELFENNNITHVYHLAAYTHVDHSFGNALIYTKNNVIGTQTLLEVMKLYPVKKFIHMSTDEVYGTTSELTDENCLLAPSNQYAASKAAAEQYVIGYHHSFKIPFIIVRGNNVYGPRQYPEKVIPRFLSRLSNGDKCQIQGNGEQRRSFIHVDDMSNALIHIMRFGNIGEIYNIASEDELDILTVAEMCISTVIENPDDHNLYIENVKDRDFNDMRYFIDGQKLIDLGWSQKINFEEGLKMTWEWYKNNDMELIWDNSKVSDALNMEEEI